MGADDPEEVAGLDADGVDAEFSELILLWNISKRRFSS